jgi:potassium channel subfamily K protein 13
LLSGSRPFCFSFATIGFGDLVSSQQANDVERINLYRCANFVFLSLGVCCVYSLFNVASIVIRQMLNCIIKKMDVRIYQPVCCKRKKRRYMGLGLRPPVGYDENESARCSVGGRDSPDGLISLKEFLLNNQSNMLLLQKQLIKSATKNATSTLDDQKITATRVGPMGILTQKFGET